MSNNIFYAVKVTFGPYDGEKEEYARKIAFERYRCAGIEEFSLDEAQVDAILGEDAYSGGQIPVSVLERIEAATKVGASVTFYFLCDDGRSFVSKLRGKFDGICIQIEEIPDKDWNEEWRKQYHSISVSRRLEIVPSWEKENHSSSAKYPIFIYPGMGFGTGNHETTFLCLNAWDNLFVEGCRPSNCLDFGCGSGILGIAAKKMQVEAVDLFDIDPDALENTRQNIELNFEEDARTGIRILSPLEKQLAVGPYELVFANILLPVLLAESDFLISRLDIGGVLILSGLLNDQIVEIKQCYLKAGNLELIEHISRGDWAALIFRRGL